MYIIMHVINNPDEFRSKVKEVFNEKLNSIIYSTNANFAII